MKKLVLSLAIVFTIWNCASDSNTDASTNTDPGETLARTYCATCHDYPSPDLLNHATWENHILPRMRNMLGLYDSPAQRAELIKDIPPNSTTIYPDEPFLSMEDWKKIKDFYLSHAPDTLTLPKREKIKIGGLKTFDVVVPPVQMSPPSSTMAVFGEDNHIYIGDAHTQSFMQLNHDLEMVNLAKVNEGAVSLNENDEYFRITVMGSFSPADQTGGILVFLPKNPNTSLSVPIKNLRRPVHSTFHDFNGDGREDIVISEFGKWAGRLSLHLQNEDKTYTSSIILNQTGAIKSLPYDFNNDGHMDLMSLFGQGNEGIYIHTNDGKANFKTKRVVPLSPSHGSCFFELRDMNDDGHIDIVYTAGDNADFPPINKPYHGIYVYLNDGKNNFEQSFFYYMNGAYAALPRDYDGDGDIDIAAISFFPDYRNTPEEGFIYLENQGDNNYNPVTFDTPTLGRWIVMDDQDYDKDGDVDLLLGSLAFEVIGNDTLVNHWVDKAIPFILLRNTTNN